MNVKIIIEINEKKKINFVHNIDIKLIVVIKYYFYCSNDRKI